MAIEITNKRINKRGREIRRFVKYLNDNYYIDHKVLLDVVDYPCVYCNNQEPAFGVFYPYYTLFKIQIANDIEFYRNRIGTGKKKIVYFVLHTIAHEIYHYFQYSVTQTTTENWIEHYTRKILCEYVKKCPSYTILTENYVSRDNIVEDLLVIDPSKE